MGYCVSMDISIMIAAENNKACLAAVNKMFTDENLDLLRRGTEFDNEIKDHILNSCKEFAGSLEKGEILLGLIIIQQTLGETIELMSTLKENLDESLTRI